VTLVGVTQQLLEAAAAVADAVLSHARAVAAESSDRPAAARALTKALDRYGNAVSDVGEDIPLGVDTFEDYLDEKDGVEEDPELPTTGERVAVFIQADFKVEDGDLLRAAAVAEVRLCCDNKDDPNSEYEMHTAAQAVSHLIGHRALFDADWLASAGVFPVAEGSLALTPTPSADPDDFLDDKWRPLLEHLNRREDPE